MFEFMQQCLDTYANLANIKGGVEAIRDAPTPFLSGSPVDDTDAHLCPGTCTFCGVRCYAPLREANRDGAVKPEPKNPDRRFAEAASDLGGADTLQPKAMKILMKILYAARYVRHDLLCVVGRLARRVQRCDKQCDRDLHRLMGYIKATKHVILAGWCGDTLQDLTLHCYADADFAGDDKTSWSTSGCCFKVTGNFTNFLTHAQAKAQSCVSHSTPESEIVAGDFALCAVALPAIDLWFSLPPTIISLFSFMRTTRQ